MGPTGGSRDLRGRSSNWPIRSEEMWSSRERSRHDNFCSWFEYRGERIHLTSDHGPSLGFPSDDFGRRARVTGRLQRQDRPSLDREAMNNPLVDRKLVPCFIVRGAKVEYLEEQSDWEHRFGPIYWR